MLWQYDPQKAQLEHKAQICAKFHKQKSNSSSTVVRKQKRDARPPARPPAGCPPIRRPDGILFFPLPTIPESNSCLG